MGQVFIEAVEVQWKKNIAEKEIPSEKAVPA
jgi:hypothetical protein